MKIYYYRATKRIDKTALLAFIQRETRRNTDVTIKMSEVGGVVYFWTSDNELLKKVDELYPNVFVESETPPPPPQGTILFANC